MTLERHAKSKTKSSGTSSTSSQISVKHVSNILEVLKANQNRESTVKNYLGIWRHFNAFLIRLDTKTTGCWEDKVALFGAYLADQGVQSQTLKSYISAIKNVLKTDGYQWADKKILFSALVRGCKLKNDVVKTRLPIRFKLLDLIMFEVERMSAQLADGDRRQCTDI